MIAALIFAITLHTQTCNSTVFGYPGDKWAGGDALYLKRPVNNTDMGIAHRWLPLGSAVVIQHLRTGKVARGIVIDRGPYGAIHKGRWVLKRRRRNPGVWRSCVDLTPAMARALGHDGFDKVKLLAWRYKENL